MDLIDVLLDRFDVEPGVAARDVDDFLVTLSEGELLER